MSLLSGCVTTSYEELTVAKNVCEADLQLPEIREAVKSCEERGDTRKACQARTPEPDSDICWVELWQRDEAIARREEREKAKSYCSSRGLATYCYNNNCWCVTRAEISRVFGHRY